MHDDTLAADQAAPTPVPPPKIAAERTRTVAVWDLPTRVFHWVLVLLLIVLYASGEGWLPMSVHMLAGEAVLALVIYRVLWGLVGSPSSRFTHFVRGPKGVISYLKAMAKGAPEPLAHNPVGALMVLGLLTLLTLLAVTGLFSTDDIATDGPLASLVSSSTMKTFTFVHKTLFNVILALIALHILVAVGSLVFKHENRIRPMVLGVRRVSIERAAEAPKIYGPVVASLFALVLLAGSGAFVWWVVRLGG
ncbi:cytochrome B [Rhodospirillum rubrum]|uniref:cytochrome b/b6 domain-containing protein n=1 Tax=Rhodospirillum rubrum TaxID=1085 RepID=UPI001905E717|nr:cytochrome b/b6 domain-containing protein [Rhodospirillum rubrum]MBK1664204.1 cytochrome B [Rhodospirillum rubrum]